MWKEIVEVAKGNRSVHFFWVILGVAIVMSSYSVVHLFSTGAKLVTQLPEYTSKILEETYPAELEITVKDGVASSNVTEPYFVKVKVARLREVIELFDPNGGKNLPNKTEIRVLTINTAATGEDFDKYQTLALLTRDKLFYQGRDGMESASLSEWNDITINKDFLKTKLQELLGSKVLVWILKYGAFVIAPLVFASVWIATWIHVLFMGLLVYFIGRIMQIQNWKYMTAIILAMVIFLGFDVIASIFEWVNVSGWPIELLATLWQLLGFGFIYVLLRIRKNSYEK